MKNAMVHWNGHQLCVVDCETTGLEPGWHELIQICILPLDSNIQPRKDVFPFYIEIIPEHPKRADPKAMQVNQLNFAIIGQRGHDAEKAKDLLEDWVEKLKLPYTKYGNRKKIIPLAQNFPFDRAFIQEWLGIDLYNDIFHWQYRDTMATASYLNDRSAMHGEKTPYPKVNLAYLASKMKIKMERAHDALSDCVTTAEIYRRMTLEGLLG